LKRTGNRTASGSSSFPDFCFNCGVDLRLFVIGSIIANYYTEVSEIVLEQLESCVA